MALPSSGPISMSNIANEFGGFTPHSMNEYAPEALSGWSMNPTAVSFSDFYGVSGGLDLTCVLVGGGGGGRVSGSPAGSGGSGGGGNGSNSGAGGNGTNGLGGGGGGAGGSGCYKGGDGGSGVVLIRVPKAYAATGTTGSPSITTIDAYTVYQFNASGTITFTI